MLVGVALLGITLAGYSNTTAPAIAARHRQTPRRHRRWRHSWASAIFLDGIVSSDIVRTNPNWQEQRKALRAKFTTAAFPSAVTRWSTIFDRGIFNSDALTVDYSALAAKYANGRELMYPTGCADGTPNASFSVGSSRLLGRRPRRRRSD